MDVPDAPADWSPGEWANLDAWTWGVDLFNHGYYWEAHEAFEALWHAAGRSGERAAFAQGLVHLSAACLNRRRGHADAARRQAGRALEALAGTPANPWMGLDVAVLAEEVRAWRDDPDRAAPTLRLDPHATRPADPD